VTKKQTPKKTHPLIAPKKTQRIILRFRTLGKSTDVCQKVKQTCQHELHGRRQLSIGLINLVE